MMVPQEFRDEPARHPEGTLRHAGGGGNIYGDHPGFVRPVSIYTRAATHPMLTSAAVAGGVAVAAMAAAWAMGAIGENTASKLCRPDNNWPRLPR
jgi:hypothetical protein